MRLLMARAERAAARRADQRPRHRHADRARGSARRLAGHARGRQPRPLLRRARLRRRLRAHRDGGIRHLPGGIEQYIEQRGAEPRHRANPARALLTRGHGAGRRAAPRGAQGGPALQNASWGDWRARSSASPSASGRCTSRWPRTPPTTLAWRSCSPSSSATPPSAKRSRRRGWRRQRPWKADLAPLGAPDPRSQASRSRAPRPPYSSAARRRARLLSRGRRGAA